MVTLNNARVQRIFFSIVLLKRVSLMIKLNVTEQNQNRRQHRHHYHHRGKITSVIAYLRRDAFLLLFSNQRFRFVLDQEIDTSSSAMGNVGPNKKQRTQRFTCIGKQVDEKQNYISLRAFFNSF